MRPRVLLCLFVFVAAWIPDTAEAQLYGVWHRPVDVEYERFETDHFRVIHQEGLKTEAGELAGILERTLPGIRDVVGLRRKLDVPLVVNGFTDRSNGFVTPFPFRQEIEWAPIRGHVLSPRFEGWFETVGPHELVHAAHAESGHGLGIGWLLRRLGPDLARGLNLSGPRGINEGIAVWMESRVRPRAGRLNHSLFAMEFRAAMDAGRGWSLAQMLEPPSYTRPFDRYYHGGAYLFAYLTEDGDVPFFRRARNFYYRFSLLGYGPALWYGTGQMPHVLGRRIRRHYRREASSFRASLGEVTDVDVVASGRGTVHRRPVWLGGNTLLTYAHGYRLRPGFYRIDLDTGEREAVAVSSITEDFMFALDDDRSSVLFSRYTPDPLEPIRATADVFRLNLANGRTSRVTRGERLFAPTSAQAGGIWALRNAGPTNVWVDLDDAGTAEVGAAPRTQFLAVEPSPSTPEIAVLANRDGRQGIYRAGLRGGALTELQPWLQFPEASVYDVSWSADGQYLLFSADPDGVSNVFVWARRGDRVFQLTNVPYGALEPSLSPDQSTVAFVNYRHERYDIASVPFDLSAAREWSRDAVRYFPEVPAPASTLPSSGAEAAPAISVDGDYRPLLSVRPRVIYPFFVYQRPTGDDEDVNLGFGAGAGMEWADPLQYWSAHTHLFYQHNALWGRALVRSGRFLLRPSAELYREPSTVIIRRVTPRGADTLRAGREERGLGAAVRLPIVFESNVFRTTASGVIGAEYRSERLFGRDGETIRDRERRVTMRPLLSLAYRLQSNPRDIVANSGVSISVFSALDVWSESENESRWLRADADAYVPIFRRSSTAVRLFGSLLVQNRGGLVDLTRFFPRGFETETLFLGGGSFGKLGAEITQPLWYIDDGLIVLPFYARALFAYGFVESMGGLTGMAQRRTVAGGGLGLQLRLFHGLDVTLRFAPVYRFGPEDWEITFR